MLEEPQQLQQAPALVQRRELTIVPPAKLYPDRERPLPPPPALEEWERRVAEKQNLFRARLHSQPFFVTSEMLSAQQPAPRHSSAKRARHTAIAATVSRELSDSLFVLRAPGLVPDELLPLRLRRAAAASASAAAESGGDPSRAFARLAQLEEKASKTAAAAKPTAAAAGDDFDDDEGAQKKRKKEEGDEDDEEELDEDEAAEAAELEEEEDGTGDYDQAQYGSDADDDAGDNDEDGGGDGED